MSHIERELAKQVDNAVLNASPEFLKLIQNLILKINYQVIHFMKSIQLC